MPGDKSIFSYRIINTCKSVKEIQEAISEELNKGLAFVVSDNEEKTVTLAGKPKGWVTVHFTENSIDVFVDDRFFCSECIIEQILTSLWANLLDFGEIRLEEFQLSDSLHSLLSSKNQDKSATRKLFEGGGPLFGTIFKPSFGLSLSEKIDISRQFAAIGGNIVKEDETYLVEKTKLLAESQTIQENMSKISDRCYYVPNITPFLLDESFLQELHAVGIQIVMVNFLITGMPIVDKIAKRNERLLFWGHRVGYKSMERYIAMKAVGMLAAYSGMNMIHTGIPFFSRESSVTICLNIIEKMQMGNPDVIPVFTKSSHQGVSELVKRFGRKIIIMTCGHIRTNGRLDWEKAREWIKRGGHRK